MEEQKLTAKEIFEQLKAKKNNVTDETLDEFYNNCLYNAKKLLETNQTKALSRIKFLMDCVERERELVKNGVNSFIYLDDIYDFLENKTVRESEIKFIELEEYTRIIPDEIIESIKLIKPYVDKFYVLFTDYTGSIEKKALREEKILKKEKDPILFATFNRLHNTNNVFSPSKSDINDRFYVVGDWEDEWCDLTLDRFLSITGSDKLNEIFTPTTKEEIILELERYDDNMRIKNSQHSIPTMTNKTFFQKVRGLFKHGK